jgi:Skp family chaperone for outer membrane proteins
VRIKNKQLIYTVFGIHEKEIGDLLKLNEDLDRYKDALLAFYFRVEAMPEKSTKWRETQLEYEKIKTENARYLTEHDRLTGKIDLVIQKAAQEKTIEMIQNTNYYGRGNTSEG